MRHAYQCTEKKKKLYTIQHDTTRHDAIVLFSMISSYAYTGNSPVDYNFPISPRNGQGLKYRISSGNLPTTSAKDCSAFRDDERKCSLFSGKYPYICERS